MLLPGLEDAARPADKASPVLQLPGTALTFTLRRCSCSRITLSVDKDGSVLVSAPADAALDDVFAMLRKKLDWIAATRALAASPREQHLRLPGTDEEFLLVRCRHKNVRLSVGADGALLVRAPATMPLEDIHAIVRKHLGWIAETRALAAAPRVQTLRLPGTDIDFLLARDRHKSVRLSLMPGGLLLVKAPVAAAMEAIYDALRRNLEWIRNAVSGASPRLRQKRPHRQSPPEVLQLPGSAMAFTLVRDRFKTLRLSVNPGGQVLVKAPVTAALASIYDFVRSQAAWIEKKRALAMQARPHCPFRDGAMVCVLGKARALRVLPPASPPALSEEFLDLPCRTPAAGGEPSETDIRQAYLDWRQRFAEEYLADKLTFLGERARAVLGDRMLPSALTVRSLRGRWGSCRQSGAITLAADLVELPVPLIEHVICHELCHLREMNHGKAFHALLERLSPGDRELRRAIREWCQEHPRD